MITAKPAPAANSGTASPRCSVSAPETAGPATPPTPALATDPIALPFPEQAPPAPGKLTIS